MPIEPEPGGPFRSTEVFQCSNRVRIVFVPMPLPLPRFEVSADAQGAQHHAKHVQKGGAWDSNNLLSFSFRAQNCSGKKKQYHAKKRDGTKCQESKKSPGIDDCHVLSLRNKSHLCMYHHIIYAAFRINQVHKKEATCCTMLTFPEISFPSPSLATPWFVFFSRTFAPCPCFMRTFPAFSSHAEHNWALFMRRFPEGRF